MTAKALPFPPGSGIVAYLRDSGGREQDLSVLQQEEAVLAWGNENHCTVTQIYRDIARSGTKTAGRDQFLEMVSHLGQKSTPAAGVLFWEYARLSRDYDDLMYYVADLRRQGYTIYSITDQIPDGLEGRLMESIIAWKNAKYIEDLRKNVRRGRRYLINAHGALPGGTTPTGYRFTQVNIGVRRDGAPHLVPQLEPDPVSGPLVTRAFEMRARGATYLEINQETHLFKWLSNYRTFLRNEIYIGVLTFDEIRVENFCTPLVDQETWDTVQLVNARRKERRASDHPRAVHSRFILSGLIFCGQCGMRMHAYGSPKPQYGKSYDYYRCRSHFTGNSCNAAYLAKPEIEQRVLSTLENKILNPATLKDVYAEANRQAAQNADSGPENLARLRAELASVRARLQRLVAAIAEAGHSKTLLNEIKELEASQETIEGKITDVELSMHPQADANPEQVAAATREALQIATDTEKAVILRGFLVKITAQKSPAGDGEIVGTIEYRLPGIHSPIKTDL